MPKDKKNDSFVESFLNPPTEKRRRRRPLGPNVPGGKGPSGPNGPSGPSGPMIPSNRRKRKGTGDDLLTRLYG